MNNNVSYFYNLIEHILDGDNSFNVISFCFSSDSVVILKLLTKSLLF